MLTVLCVLRSGGVYDYSWVEKLRRGVERNLTVPHRFACLSDVPAPCERIVLRHNWPSWWSKIECFRPDVVTGPTLYLDLDTVICGSIDPLAGLPMSFGMLRNFGRAEYIGSGIMWFRDRPPAGVYERFAADPDRLMNQYRVDKKRGAHFGDQAFIFEAVGDANIGRIQDAVPGLIRLYPRDFESGVRGGCSVAVFKGKVKPPDAMHVPQLAEAWA